MLPGQPTDECGTLYAFPHAFPRSCARQLSLSLFASRRPVPCKANLN
jgi:hypothetical protein